MPAMATRITTAARAMGTATSRRLLGASATVILCAACGGPGPYGSAGASARSKPSTSPPSKPRSSFSWLKPQPPPTGWRQVTIPSGAAVAYPASWHPQHGDAGTATAALLTRRGAFLGYLNITPRQGPEQLTGWAAFRLHHNREEGDSHVRELASATGLHFRTGRGSCVEDSYATTIHAHFVEIACLVAGAKATTVIVGAAPPADWSQPGAGDRAGDRWVRDVGSDQSQPTPSRLVPATPCVGLAVAVRAQQLKIFDPVVVTIAVDVM